MFFFLLLLMLMIINIEVIIVHLKIMFLKTFIIYINI